MPNLCSQYSPCATISLQQKRFYSQASMLSPSLIQWKKLGPQFSVLFEKFTLVMLYNPSLQDPAVRLVFPKYTDFHSNIAAKKTGTWYKNDELWVKLQNINVSAARLPVCCDQPHNVVDICLLPSEKLSIWLFAIVKPFHYFYLNLDFNECFDFYTVWL